MHKKISRLVLLVLTICCGHSYAQWRTPGENAVVIERSKSALKTEAELVAANQNTKTVLLNYVDGMMRPTQSLVRKGSPGLHDIIQPYEYDANGFQTKQYLPYTIQNTNSTPRTGWKTEQSNYYTAGDDKIANDNSPFAAMDIEESPLRRALSSGNVGVDWQLGSGHEVTYTYAYNAASEVRKFNDDGTSSGFYTAELLVKISVTDEHGNESITYTNKSGQAILTKNQLDETIDGSNVPFLETYYIYDDLERLAFILSPKAVAQLASNSWNLTASIKDDLCYQFKYDERGRLIEKRVPGTEWNYFVYDQLNRPVLFQDGNLDANNQWMFVKYDIKGRSVINGVFSDSRSRAALQTVFDNFNYDASDHYYEERANNVNGYTNQVFPTASTTNYNIVYYDDYDFNFNGAPDYSYTNQGLGIDEPTPTTMTRGMVLGIQTRIIGTSTMLKKVAFYDDKGRMIQLRENNQLYSSSVLDDATTFVYDFEGKVLKAKRVEKVATSNILTKVQSFTYDHAGRILEIRQKLDSDPEHLVASYEYNELGQLVEKNLDGLGTSVSDGFLQSMDMRYHIRGWLSSINNSKLEDTQYSSDSDNDDADDLFGMNILYNENLDGNVSNSNTYNGNISAIKWQSYDPLNANQPERERVYYFSYDKVNQLQHAAYAARDDGTNWNKESGAYEVNNVNYDHNGNILKLHRFNQLTENNSRDLIDGLTYTYDGNHLTKVEDSGSASGFNNGANVTTEYQYDDNGNMTSDENKDVTLTYNTLNKIASVSKPSGGSITYQYDGQGKRIARIINDGSATATQYYIGSSVYEGTDLKFTGMAEGRVNKTSGGAYEYEYYMTDHLGNVRTSFKKKEVTLTYEATHEDVVQESQYFDNLNPVSFGSANHTPGGSDVTQLNSSNKVGPGLALTVKAGDVLDIEAYAYHENTSGYSGSNGFTTMVTAIAGAFGGLSTGGEQEQFIHGALNDALTALGLGGHNGNNQPAAYLTYILFDQEMNYVSGNYDGVTNAAFYAHQKLDFSSITVAENGYLYVYVSNESSSSNTVYFDDIKVTHQAQVPEVTASNHYYPFGLRMQGIANNTPFNQSANQHGFNGGSELQNDVAGLPNYWSTGLREYDPILGRFNGVDIMASKYASLTPYNFGFNSPILWNDPTGADPEEDEIITIRDLLKKIHDMLEDDTNAFGGSWNSGDGWSDFGSSTEAFGAGAGYAGRFNMWGSYEGMAASLDNAVSRYTTLNPNVSAQKNNDGSYTLTEIVMSGATFFSNFGNFAGALLIETNSVIVQAPQQNNPFPTVNQKKHEVQRGDNLYQIGKKNGISPETLRKLNGLRGNKILPGQKLIVETLTHARVRTFNEILNSRINYAGTQTQLRNTPLGNYLEKKLNSRLTEGSLSGIEFILFTPRVINPINHWLNIEGGPYWRSASWSQRAFTFDKFCSDGRCR